MHRLFPETLVTARLRLRAPKASDAPTIFTAYTQDPAVSRFMIWRPHAELAVTQAFIDSCIEAFGTGAAWPFIITTRDSDSAIGMIEARPQAGLVDIGYVLARPHWGRGCMPEAITALADAALQRPDVYRVQASCDCENIGSQRALEKSGFQREGRLERHAVFPNLSPEPRACFMYAHCR